MAFVPLAGLCGAVFEKNQPKKESLNSFTIISRFEIEFRKFISTKLHLSYSNFKDGIPNGVVTKAISRAGEDNFTDAIELLDETDFPDLAEICVNEKNYKEWVNFKIKKEEFSAKMGSLYNLRCKVAHVKGNFTSLDLDKLIELTIDLSSLFEKDNELSELIKNIENNIDEFVDQIPLSFYSNYSFVNIPNNIPIADYEYEGGFVGREEDKKSISKYLISQKFPVVTITGAGGVGKTSLALNVINELLSKTPNKFDAVVWLSAKENMLSPMGIEDIEPSLKNYDEMLSIILEVLGFKNESTLNDILEKENAINTVLSIANHILVVVDNLETITDERIINFIIEAPLNVKFLVTSRRGIGQIEIRHELVQLKEAEAVYLFRKIANDKQIKSLLKVEDRIIKKYVNRVSCYPLAIKWVVGQIARGKDINRVIDSIHESASDISKFCFDQIFNDLSSDCQLVLFSLCCLDDSPSAGVLEFIVGIDHERFEDSIEELILVSIIIPEQYKNEQQEIARKFSILSLTRAYIRQHLSSRANLRASIEYKIGKVQSTITATEKAKREYRYSLNNIGASTDEEKIAAIYLQTATQKYQSGKYDSAVEDYKNAANIAPRFSSIYRNWSVMEAQESRTSEAEKLIEKAQILNNSDPQIWLIWGNILKRAGRLPEAISKYEQAYKIAPNDNIILNAYGQIKSRLGEHELASELLLKALSIDDQYSKKHEIITRTNLASNLIDWSILLRRDRNFDLAELKLTEAIDHASKAVELDSNDFNSQTIFFRSLLMNGHYYKKIGKIEKAVVFYNKLNDANVASKNIIGNMFCASGVIDLIKYYLDYDKIEQAKQILDDSINRFAPVFRRYPNILEDFNLLIKTTESTKVIRGHISYVEENLKYVLISVNGSPSNTYHASYNNFRDLPNGISNDLLNCYVEFTPFVTTTLRGESKKARNIQILSWP